MAIFVISHVKLQINAEISRTRGVLKIPFSFRFFTSEKEAICSYFNSSVASGNLLTCDIACCDGSNCNHPNFTGKYPIT